MTAERARDALGRPVAEGSPDAVPGVVAAEEIDADDAWHRAMHYLETGMPFHAHEVFEWRWRCCPDAERALWRGLAQWGAALTHRARGNAVGAASVGRNALRTLDGAAGVGPVDLDAVRASLQALVTAPPSAGSQSAANRETYRNGG